MYKKTIRNILVKITVMAAITSFTTSRRAFLQKKSEEFSSQPLKNESVLTVQEIAHLPVCVQKYLEYTGAVGKSKPQNVFIEFDAEMYRKPGDKPMKSHSVQYNFYRNYSRLFLMKARKMGIPFSALHVYRNEAATFRVKVAELFKVVDIRGEELTKAETVTVLNDLCIFAPGCLADKRLTWSEEDMLSAKVTLKNGRYLVSAILCFNETGELVNFISGDRSALQDDGTLRQATWETPVSDYKSIDGRMIPTYGKTIWKYPEGDFTYGVFRLKSLKYNLAD
ncbi:MAG: hypothetical protein MUE32_04580 [Bacteroidales bacterium]|nr:hypothetical protein [Bacteroidales bacterium]